MSSQTTLANGSHYFRRQGQVFLKRFYDLDRSEELLSRDHTRPDSMSKKEFLSADSKTVKDQ